MTSPLLLVIIAIRVTAGRAGHLFGRGEGPGEKRDTEMKKWFRTYRRGVYGLLSALLMSFLLAGCIADVSEWEGEETSHRNETVSTQGYAGQTEEADQTDAAGGKTEAADQTDAAGGKTEAADQTDAAGGKTEAADQTDAAGGKTEAGTKPEQTETKPKKTEAETEETPELDRDGVYTSKEDVALYLYLYGELPDNFITKKEARKLGWEGGSLEPYAPGKCIGGDRFGNYEGILPEASGRTYKECDIDTLYASSRGAKRIVYSSDGLIYYTEDHYASFELIYPEEGN